jgi:hypothetical protein
MVLGLVACMCASGCVEKGSALSSVSGRVHYVVIEDGVSDNQVSTQAGEEVRWVNVRKTPVSVVFDWLGHGDLSCERGFANSTNAHISAVILPDHHASLCFSTVGRRTYRVLDASRTEIELNHEAAVETVASP